MKTIKVIFAVLMTGVFGLSGLLLSGSVHGENIRVVENLRGETVILPSSAPETDQLILVSFVTMATGAEIVGALAAYDDPKTIRSVDYMEFYDGAGSLLLVSWADRFGIRRTAMDRGILQEEASMLEGILVLLSDGIPA